MNRLCLPLTLVLALAAVLVLPGCSDTPELKVPVYKTGLKPDESMNNEFGKVFPAEYKTYLKNNEDKVMTEYKGSVQFDKNDNVNPLPKGYKHAQPYLKNLWLGYPFSYEYKETRGHTYALEDILHIDRINTYGEKAGLPATCWNCKTPKMLDWVKEHGDGFWAKDFNEFRTVPNMKEQTIGCANCHEPETMKLRITSVPLNDYFKRKNIDPAKLTRNEMRGYVCGQCHVEYYFADPKHAANKKPIFPWDDGFSAEQMYGYYRGHGSATDKGFEGAFVDWVHPVTKTPMLKAQHPEYETWVDGTHGAAGVTCADCHMFYTREEGGKKISSHWWTSPLKDIDRSCRTCHKDKTADYLKERVLFTQKKAFDQLLIAQELSVKAHEALRLALEYQGEKAADYDALIVKARDMLRKGQFFWDLVSAENSVGFHNPSKTLDTLASSQQFSQQAVDYAMQATNFGIGKDLAGDIKSIVPPILYHSRKLQQSPEHLATHKWFKYLPVLPKADKLWDGQKKLTQAAPEAAPAAPAAPAPTPAGKS